jgi:hypothetical protein
MDMSKKTKAKKGNVKVRDLAPKAPKAGMLKGGLTRRTSDPCEGGEVTRIK